MHKNHIMVFLKRNNLNHATISGRDNPGIEPREKFKLSLAKCRFPCNLLDYSIVYRYGFNGDHCSIAHNLSCAKFEWRSTRLLL
jgi:hypothetical protein